MNVVYGCDDGYAFLLITSLVSLLENNKYMHDLRIYIVSDGICQENIELMKHICLKYNRELIIKQALEIENYVGVDIDYGHYSPAVYIRLYLGDLITDVERVLWLDCDTIIEQDLTDLWKTNIGENYCGACVENSSISKKKNGFGRYERYYNSGVMLIRLDLWRLKETKEGFVRVLRNQKGYSFDADQGVINQVLRGRIHTLPLKYNVTSKDYLYGFRVADCINGFWDSQREYYGLDERKNAIEQPAIVHFLEDHYGLSRPWQKKCIHPKKNRWMHYYMMTGLGALKRLPNRKLSLNENVKLFFLRCVPVVYVNIKSIKHRI